MRVVRVLSGLVLVLVASSCAEPVGDERLARQASLGMTIEHQAIRFADRVLTDAVDCSASPESNALAIATMIEGNLGSCAEVLQTGSGVDVTTGASCDFGFDTITSLATQIAVSREGSELVFAFELPRARINGLEPWGPWSCARLIAARTAPRSISRRTSTRSPLRRARRSTSGSRPRERASAACSTSSPSAPRRAWASCPSTTKRLASRSATAGREAARCVACALVRAARRSRSTSTRRPWRWAARA